MSPVPPGRAPRYPAPVLVFPGPRRELGSRGPDGAAVAPRGGLDRAPLRPRGGPAPMGPTRKPNVCRRLSRRALGFFSSDAGAVQRTNLGILRALVCQVTACGQGRDRGLRAPGAQAGWGAVFTRQSPLVRRLFVMGGAWVSWAWRISKWVLIGPPGAFNFLSCLCLPCKQSSENLVTPLKPKREREAE